MRAPEGEEDVHDALNLPDPLRPDVGLLLDDEVRERDEAGGVERDRLLGPRVGGCLLYTSPSPRDATLSRMPSSA